VYLTHHQSCKQ